MVDIIKFFYDQQGCVMSFVFLGYLLQEVNFNVNGCFLFMSSMVKNLFWEISDQVDLSLISFSGRNILIVRFSFLRKFDFYMINIIFLMVVIVFLYIIVFFFLVDFGEWIGFLMIIIFFIIVYQIIVSDSLLNLMFLSFVFILYKFFVDFFISIIVYIFVVVSFFFYL